MLPISIMSLAGVGAYSIVLIACLAAAFEAVRQQQPFWHYAFWALICWLFAVCITMRLFGLEEMLRDGVRETFRLQGGYDDRQSWQVPLVVGVVWASGFAALYGFRKLLRQHSGRRMRSILIALAASVAMIVLIIVRLISLHSIDYLLYGPLRLNWFADIGLSVIILACAAYYWRLMRPRTL